jgi:hypothetical protein
VDLLRLAHRLLTRHQTAPVGGPEPVQERRALTGDRGTGHERRINRLTVPGEANDLDALDGVPLSDGERASLTWLAGFEAHTVENMAAVITRARRSASARQ